MKKSRLVQNQRMMLVLGILVAIFVLLLVRTAWIQIVNGEDLSRRALEQQTSDNTVSAKRGNIYDRNYKVLASNTTVETISITPENLRNSLKDNGISEGRAAEGIAEILGMQPQTIENKIQKKSNCCGREN